MALLLLPNELLLEIIKRAHSVTKREYRIDAVTLDSLTRLCKQMCGLVRVNWSTIVTTYTRRDQREVRPNENHCYTFCGLLHREDGPAELVAGCPHWYRYGQRHRDGDLPAVIEDASHWLEWWQRGKRHRDVDLPAFYRRCIWTWYKDGLMHRDHGHASVQLIWPHERRQIHILPWDGYSDVSAADFDWSQLIDVARLPWPISQLSVSYEEYHHGKRTYAEIWDLKAMFDGRIVTSATW